MTTTAIPPVKLDRHQAANYLGVTYATLCTWATHGRGPRFAKIGRKVVYFQRELDLWIEERSTNCSSALDS